MLVHLAPFRNGELLFCGYYAVATVMIHASCRSPSVRAGDMAPRAVAGSLAVYTLEPNYAGNTHVGRIKGVSPVVGKGGIRPYFPLLIPRLASLGRVAYYCSPNFVGAG